MDLLSYRGNQEKLKRHLRVVLIDLYARYLEDPSGYLQYSRNAGKYREGERYNKLFIKYDPLIRAVDYLEALSYIEGAKGFFDRVSGKSRESRMRATPKLIEALTESYGMHPGMVSSVEREVVILRDRAKNDIPYTDDAETNRMRNVVKRYIAQLEGTYIDVIVKGYKAKQAFDINLNDKFIRRIFNNSSWNEGGRFYGGWWQRIPSDLRRRIVIFGKETIEIDYSSIHIAILYAFKGVDYFASGRPDPYAIPGYPVTAEYRALFKLILLTVLNSSDEKAARRAVQFEINKAKWDYPSGINLQKAIKAFESIHPDIASYFYSGIGTKLQYIDSQIAEKIIEHFLSSESICIPPLVIHDSFVVSKHAEAELTTVMRTAFDDVLRTESLIDLGLSPKTKAIVWEAYRRESGSDDDLAELEAFIASDLHDAEQQRRHEVWQPGLIQPSLHVRPAEGS